MLQGEVFVFEFVAVDGFATGAIVIGEITGLTHEVWNDTMENGSFVSETLLTSAQCTEVFASLWYYVRTKLQVEKSKEYEQINNKTTKRMKIETNKRLCWGWTELVKRNYRYNVNNEWAISLMTVGMDSCGIAENVDQINVATAPPNNNVDGHLFVC